MTLSTPFLRDHQHTVSTRNPFGLSIPLKSEDTRATFLTTAQSSIAFGVAAIGGVFFSRLGATPSAASYFDALLSALSCNLVLQAATFLLVTTTLAIVIGYLAYRHVTKGQRTGGVSEFANV